MPVRGTQQWKLEGRCLSAGSQLRQVNYLHSSSQCAGLCLPPLTLTAAVFLHQHLLTVLAAPAEEKLVSEKWRVQDLCSTLRLQVMLEGGREREGEILPLPGSGVATKR